MLDRGPLARNGRRPWKEPESRSRHAETLGRDNTIKTLLDGGYDLASIAAHIHRTPRQTENLIRALGYRTAATGPMYARARWDEWEERIRRLFEHGLGIDAIANLIGPPITVHRVRHVIYNRQHLDRQVSLQERRKRLRDLAGLSVDSAMERLGGAT